MYYPPHSIVILIYPSFSFLGRCEVRSATDPTKSVYLEISIWIHSVIVKFADDSTVAGLIHKNNERHYLAQIQNLVECGDFNDLHINVTKTKEIVVDFRNTKKRLKHHS